MLMEIIVEIYYLTWYTVHGAKKVQKSSINQLDSGVFCGHTSGEKRSIIMKDCQTTDIRELLNNICSNM